MRTLHVVLAGGGTAGHIEPALNLADALLERRPDAVVTALGTSGGLETRLVPQRGFALELIPAVPLPRKPNVDLATLPFRLRGAIREVRAILARTGADVLVGFGGYVAMPAYLGARNRVPMVVHEANARPGLANRIGARFTPYVAETVAGSLPRARLVGIPLRRGIASLDRAALRKEAATYFGLDPALPTLLVSGGSQGARRLNEAVAGAVPRLRHAGVQILHVVGPRNSDQLHDREPGYLTVPFVERMDLAYAVADLALCRAGAMTCAELAAVGLPAIYVPLPIGNGEQRLNALPVVQAGGGVLVADAELSADRVVSEVVSSITDPAGLRTAGQAARQHGATDGARLLVDMVLQAAATGVDRTESSSGGIS